MRTCSLSQEQYGVPIPMIQSPPNKSHPWHTGIMEITIWNEIWVGPQSQTISSILIISCCVVSECQADPSFSLNPKATFKWKNATSWWWVLHPEDLPVPHLSWRRVPWASGWTCPLECVRWYSWPSVKWQTKYIPNPHQNPSFRKIFYKKKLLKDWL